MPMLTSDETPLVHANAHAHDVAMPMLTSEQCRCSRPTRHRRSTLMPMLTSDETPLIRANAHAHVEARAPRDTAGPR